MNKLKTILEFFRITLSIIPIILFMIVMTVWYAVKQPKEPIGKFVSNKINKKQG